MRDLLQLYAQNRPRFRAGDFVFVQDYIPCSQRVLNSNTNAYVSAAADYTKCNQRARAHYSIQARDTQSPPCGGLVLGICFLITGQNSLLTLLVYTKTGRKSNIPFSLSLISSLYSYSFQAFGCTPPPERCSVLVSRTVFGPV